MKKVILQYLASALTVILILGLVVSNRQRNQSLVKKVKDPEISYIYQDSLENLDRLALTHAGVIQSYQLDDLSVRKEDGKIRLVLHVNHSYDMQVNLVLKADIYGDLSVVQATPSKALKLALEDESYQKRLTLISQKEDAIMARDHWDSAIKPAYVAQVRSKMKKTSLTQLDKVLQDIDQESKEVGSDTYTAFFQASQLPNHDKLDLVMTHMQVYVDKYQFLQLGKSGYKFSKKLEPTSPFYSYFREAIMETYQTDLGLGIDDLGIKLHLFRSWIDKQSMDYIRTNYKGKTDVDKLLAYSKDKKIKLDYTTGASYHNRSLGDFTYPQNMKIQLPQTSVMGPYGVSNSRFIEFIVNMDTRKFVSEWNVYKKRKDGSIDSNPKHYKIEDGADIADTDSANYGLSKGSNADLPAYLNNSHTYLDVRHPADNAIRRKMVRKWKNAKNVLNGGHYADIVKKGGLKDLEIWRQVKAEDRLQVYNAYLDYIRSHLVLNGFDSFYQETYKPQGGDKKD
ncbi:DUF1310 family protein [Streptococcus thermophilus]|uniref:DUF1310 family protein n=1 Tax=Streptococcus thermophilus TaxID=1308 RepID=UPI0015C24C48|nr:DUF1310 family protein [Streptococcus thermophilus]MBW7794146.1 DUF1310 family protein [Streptococcus thermophilus]MCT2940997.1 DUF1310 family protein [Streptococcus thermophilus]CAD0123395.1 conserved protein of unknown function [Streptococcus thermophilus]